MKVSIVGLDGLYFSILKSFCNSGYLPFIKSMLNKSVIGELISTLPPYTPPAWTSIASGVYPDKHRIFGFLRVTKAMNSFNIKLNTAYNVHFPRIWEILAMQRRSSVIVNVPLIYPFRAMVSKSYTIIIPGWDSPIKKIYPSNLQHKFHNALLQPYEWWDFIRYADERAYIRAVEQALQARVETILELVDSINWNLLFIIFSETDWIMHRFVNIHLNYNLKLFSGILRILDHAIRHIRNPSDLTIICSDHGFKLYRGRFYVNELLYKYGYLKYHITRLQSSSTTQNSTSNKNSLLSSFISHGYPIVRVLARSLPERVLRKVFRKLAGLFKFKIVIDPKYTIAFAPEYGSVYVRRGFLSYVKRILEDNTNYMHVLQVSDVYRSWNNNFPDIILMPKNNIWPTAGVSGFSISGSLLDLIPHPDHAMHGVFIASGDDILPGNINRVYCVDITPTVLAYMGLLIPKRVDGKVIDNIVYNKHPPIFRDIYSKWLIIRKINKLNK